MSSTQKLEPWFLRALAYDLLIGALSRREGSDYLHQAADELERLQNAKAREAASGGEANKRIPPQQGEE